MTRTWTPERVARLTELWHDGMSALRIGLAMDLSKGAVCGKAHRLGLPERGTPIHPNGERAARRSLPVARMQFRIGGAMTSRRSRVVALQQAGASYGEISTQLNITKAQVCYDVYRARALGELPPVKYSDGWKGQVSRRASGRARAIKTTTQRACLGARCGKPFPSEGTHNRLCETCRKRSDGVSYSFGGSGRVAPAGSTS